MPAWDDLERRLEQAIDALTPQMIQALDDAANILVLHLETNTPVGEIGTTPFLREAMTERGQVEIAGNAAHVGVAPKRLLGDPAQRPPPGTIRDFLTWWNATHKGTPRDDKQGKLDMGEGPFHPWWSLSREQKEALEQERAAGRFGGQPPGAPYWYTQEAGNAAALVSPQRYVERSWQAALPQIRARLMQIRLL